MSKSKQQGSSVPEIKEVDLFSFLVTTHHAGSVCGRLIKDISPTALIEALSSKQQDIAQAAIEVLEQQVGDGLRCAVQAIADYVKNPEYVPYRDRLVRILGEHGSSAYADIIIPTLVEQVMHGKGFAFAALNAYEPATRSEVALKAVLQQMDTASPYDDSQTHIVEFMRKFAGGALEEQVVIWLLEKLDEALRDKHNRADIKCLASLLPFIGSDYTARISFKVPTLLRHDRNGAYLRFHKEFIEFIQKFAESPLANAVANYLVQSIRSGDLERESKELVGLLIPFMNRGYVAASKLFCECLKAFRARGNDDREKLLNAARENYSSFFSDRNIFDELVGHMEHRISNHYVPGVSLGYLSEFAGSEFEEDAKAALERAIVSSKGDYRIKRVLEQIKNPPTIYDQLKERLVWLGHDRHTSQRLNTLKWLNEHAESLSDPEAAPKIVIALAVSLKMNKHYSNREYDNGDAGLEHTQICELLSKFAGTEHEQTAVTGLIKGNHLWSDGLYEALARFHGNQATLQFLLSQLGQCRAGCRGNDMKRIVEALTSRFDEVNRLNVV